MKYHYTNDDIEAARRGLGMSKLPDTALARIAARHRSIDTFASQVIAAAANRLLAASQCIRGFNCR